MSKIVVLGGSVGALASLKLILSGLPHDFPAAVMVVIHTGTHKSILPDVLRRVSNLPVREALEGEPIMPGHVLVAPADRHLLVTESDGQALARLVHGPKENHCRPAIDPLFRSAASNFGRNAVSVLLSGYLDDGTVGLQAIKACGGTTIVQDPLEAEAPEMPSNALAYVAVDRVLGVQNIAPALIEFASTDALTNRSDELGMKATRPAWIDVENRMSAMDSDVEDVEEIGTLSSLTCPECHGSLWEIHGGTPARYRCHTGHAFTSKVLRALQKDAVEEALWGAVRALHEQERLFGKLADKENQVGNQVAATEYEAMLARAKKHSQVLQAMITASKHVYD